MSIAQPRLAPPAQLSELGRFDEQLRLSGSATHTLTRWLAERLGGPDRPLLARIRATTAPCVDIAIMHRLGISDWADISYRRVWLVYDRRVMSIAENWYVASRLPGGMAATLADGKTPFGAAIASLKPTRETLHAERLWRWRPRGETSDDRLSPPGAVLRHRALVGAGDGPPLCEVSEVYTRNILAV